ncbi:MAG: alpha/beta hydrolase [Candidatus Levybacteria bacterium]|nr:alpha/beta hydrolase [Candidatus Levybacteria bacterium]
MAQKINTLKKPPIIFIHGAGGGGWEWAYWKKYFVFFGYSVYNPTLTVNNKQLADVGIFDYVEQLQNLVDKLSQKPYIIGASMGGFLAQKIGEIAPVAGIVLVNSVPPWPTKKYKYVPDVIRWSTESTLQDTIACMPEADKKTILLAHKKWRDESGKVIKELRSGLPIDRKKIQTKVLVIAGANDVDIKPEVSRKIALHYNADYFQFSGVSHVGALLGKRWKNIAALVKTWIES